jgi:hypothetical protein
LAGSNRIVHRILPGSFLVEAEAQVKTPKQNIALQKQASVPMLSSSSYDEDMISDWAGSNRIVHRIVPGPFQVEAEARVKMLKKNGSPQQQASVLRVTSFARSLERIFSCVSHHHPNRELLERECHGISLPSRILSILSVLLDRRQHRTCILKPILN